MTGRIVRLVDHQQLGAITADDGNEYIFYAGAMRRGTFPELALGTLVSFEAIPGAHGTRQATAVRVLSKGRGES